MIIDREKIDKEEHIRHVIRLCELSIRELTKFKEFKPITIHALKSAGLPVSDDIESYNKLIKEYNVELIKLDPSESENIEVLKKLRNKYVAIESIKKLIEDNFSNDSYEFKAFLDCNDEKIDSEIRFLDQKISNLYKNKKVE